VTGDLVPHQDTDSWVDVLEPAYRLAQGIARTDFVPKGLQGRPDAIMAAVLAGRERGLGPMVSLAGISVINGRPTLSAELLAALVVRAGHTITIVDATDTACEVEITRGDNASTARVRWTKSDAEQAGLWGKQGPWRQYPRQMLYARAVSECARRVCPDVAWGLDTDSAVVADTAPTTRPATTVQLTQQNAPGEGEPTPGAITLQPEPTVAAAPDIVDEPAPEPRLPQKYITKAMAELRKLEQARGRKLGRDDRLAYFAQLAGLDHLATMKDLTETQARQIIDALIAAQPAEQPPLPTEE